MNKPDYIRVRESLASTYLYTVSTLGFIIFIFSLLSFAIPFDLSIFLLLIIFIGITEYSPVPIWKGTSALSFPLLYTMDFLFGIHTAIVSYGLVVFLVNLVHRRPTRLVIFTPAQLIISLALAKVLTDGWLSLIFLDTGTETLTYRLITVLIFTLLYYVINNIIVDLLLMIRPQSYTWHHWRLKSIPEAMVTFLSILYGSFMFLLGNQNRGDIDVFSYLFFFSPLVAISLLSSTFVRIQKEKNRLKSLFSVTTALNQVLPSGELNQVNTILREFLETQAYILLMKSNGDWSVLIKDGRVDASIPLSEEHKKEFDSLMKTVTYMHRKPGESPGDRMFEDVIRSLVYSPLIVENELVGMFIVGKSRTNSFSSEDVQSLATVANQLAGLVKTRLLISEREKRVVLEERNRIAREIHDGIAQSLAGAVFILQSAQRKSVDGSEEMRHLIEETIRRLRVSLKEVRQSIYALRPYPTEKLGLNQAIAEKMESLKKDYGIGRKLEVRGRPQELSMMVEKVIYDTFQESLQNIVKHADASHVDILLSYQRDFILLKIKDDGIGFSLFEAMIKAKNEPHYGILNMNEQAEKLGASLQIDSSTGKGTEIVLMIPNLEDQEGMEDDTRHASR